MMVVPHYLQIMASFGYQTPSVTVGAGGKTFSSFRASSMIASADASGEKTPSFLPSSWQI